MKKIVVSMIIMIMFLINSTQFVYAANKQNGDWVQNAFSAARGFFDEKPKDELGIVNPIFKTFKRIVKTVNVVLMAALMGLSIIALSITGVRYIASGASPQQKEIAKQSLHTIFIGMAIGFGAYAIWRIAMSIIEVIIGALGNA